MKRPDLSNPAFRIAHYGRQSGKTLMMAEALKAYLKAHPNAVVEHASAKQKRLT